MGKVAVGKPSSRMARHDSPHQGDDDVRPGWAKHREPLIEPPAANKISLVGKVVNPL
jgi:hypothetical protein